MITSLVDPPCAPLAGNTPHRCFLMSMSLAAAPSNRKGLIQLQAKQQVKSSIFNLDFCSMLSNLFQEAKEPLPQDWR
jgi:hypothetical protein